MPDDQPMYALTPAQRLLLHQLKTLDAYSQVAGAAAERDDTEAEEEGLPAHERTIVPEVWELTRGITLYPWQETCIERWSANGRCGTVKVVTGGGKTLLALAIAQRLQNTIDPDLRVAIIVPTIVLMHQWYDALAEHGNLPTHAIGRLGGGHSDDFRDGRRVLVAVLASASEQLAGIVSRAGIGKHLLLVADECHRAGARKMSQIFDTPRASSLGLSATPERDEDDDDAPFDEDRKYDDSLLGQALGRIVYEFTLADALALGVVPTFTIHHYGLPLNPEERVRYDRLSRAISEDQAELRVAAGGAARRGFFKWTRTVAGEAGELGRIAARFNANIAQRKRLLTTTGARADAVESLLRQEFDANPDARVLLFHESIAEVMRLFVRLKDAGFAVIAEHSKLPDSLREEGLAHFRQGLAQVMVSAKSLIEGFNVPAIDVGIIVSSSGSERQRIQSLGRVLRRHRGRGGEEKTSIMHVLYVAGTTDEMIYARVDWSHSTGVDSNVYYLWDGIGELAEQPGPPRSPLPSEDEIDVDSLRPGDEYPGGYIGLELSCDAQGNVRDPSGRFYRDPGGLVEQIRRVKGQLGKLRVTPKRHLVLVRLQEGDEWTSRFVMRLDGPPQPVDVGDVAVAATATELARWGETASAGDRYPLAEAPVESESIHFSQKRGGTLVRKVRSGELFARRLSAASDRARGEDAERVLSAVEALRAAGQTVTKLEVTPLNHVVYRHEGVLKFLCRLEVGLEFPM